MSYRRDPSAPRLAHFLLALLLGLGSATVPAWSLDLGNLVAEAPNALFSRLGAVLGLWGEDSATPEPDGGGIENPDAGTGGEGDAGVIIDPNGKPKP